MSTYDFTVSGTSLIEDAMYLIGAKEEGEGVEGEVLTDALRALNMLAKSWVAHGYHRHRKQEVVIPLNKGQRQYFLGPASTDAEWADENDFFSTTLSAAAASAATTITVASSSNMALGDRIGIELSDGTRQWTTIDNISSTTVTPNSALTGAASSGATVYTYTSRPQKPLRIIHGRRRASPSGNDIEMWRLSDEEFQSQPQKDTNGTPVNYNYKPAKSDGALASGTFNVWQPPSTAKALARLTVERPIADFDSASDNPDFPAEWALALSYNLAVILEPQHGVLDDARRRDLRIDAMRYLDEVKTFDLDQGSLFIRPAVHGS